MSSFLINPRSCTDITHIYLSVAFRSASFYRPQRSCGKVMFLHLSVILFTEVACHTPLGRHTTPWHTPPRQTPPRHIPPGQTTPPTHHPWADIPPAQCMLGYGQQAGGTHPPGMHSCLCLFLQMCLRVLTFRVFHRRCGWSNRIICLGFLIISTDSGSVSFLLRKFLPFLCVASSRK